MRRRRGGEREENGRRREGEVRREGAPPGSLGGGAWPWPWWPLQPGGAGPGAGASSPLLSSSRITSFLNLPHSSSSLALLLICYPLLHRPSPLPQCSYFSSVNLYISPHRLPHITFFAPSCLFHSVLTLSPPTPEITPPPELDVPSERGSMMNGLHWLHHGPWSMLC